MIRKVKLASVYHLRDSYLDFNNWKFMLDVFSPKYKNSSSCTLSIYLLFSVSFRHIYFDATCFRSAYALSFRFVSCPFVAGLLSFILCETLPLLYICFYPLMGCDRSVFGPFKFCTMPISCQQNEWASVCVYSRCVYVWSVFMYCTFRHVLIWISYINIFLNSIPNAILVHFYQATIRKEIKEKIWWYTLLSEKNEHWANSECIMIGCWSVERQ